MTESEYLAGRGSGWIKIWSTCWLVFTAEAVAAGSS